LQLYYQMQARGLPIHDWGRDPRSSSTSLGRDPVAGVPALASRLE
jgi:hypothetical protein